MKAFRFGALMGLFLTNLVLASGGGGPKFADGVNYIEITPPLIVNYGPAGKMRYIKAEISLRTEDMHGATEITHHLPIIRDTLITILGQQTEESVGTAEGKEKLRLHALTELNKVLHLVEKGAPAEEHKDKGKEKKSDKKSDKKSKEKTKEKDKKKSDDEKHKSADESHEEHSGPISDLFFNNFVVQK